MSAPPLVRWSARPLSFVALVALAACQGDPITTLGPSAAPHLAIAPGSVTVTDLGAPADVIEVIPSGINEPGDITGFGLQNGIGYIHRGGAWSVFPDVAGMPVVPSAINDLGDVAASTRGTLANPPTLFLLRGGVTSVLAPLAPGDFAGIADLNNAGVVVGINDRARTLSAVLWSPGAAPVVLPTPAGAVNNRASAINDAGLVVGESNFRAVLWQNGAMQDLGTLGGAWSGASNVNVGGDIVGYSQTAAGPTHAFLWRAGVMSDLGTLAGMSESSAGGINDAGQVVGTSYLPTGGQQAFVWEDGVMTALPPLPGYLYSSAGAITNGGQIIGRSFLTTDPNLPSGRATLWTVPVPPVVQPPEPVAGVERPWKGTCSFDDEQLSSTVVRMTGTCALSVTGRTTYVSIRTLVAGSTTQFTSATTFTAANGDLLRTTGAGNSALSDVGGEIGTTETVTGGTGRFSRATGSAGIYGRRTTDKQGVVVGSYELTGTLDYAASDRAP